jgi:hypothetical protein
MEINPPPLWGGKLKKIEIINQKTVTRINLGSL